MTKEQKVIEVLESVYNNSSNPYKNNGKTYVDNLDVKSFVLEVVNKLS